MSQDLANLLKNFGGAAATSAQPTQTVVAPTPVAAQTVVAPTQAAAAPAAPGIDISSLMGMSTNDLYDSIPDGTYGVTVEKITFKISSKNDIIASVKYTVISEQYNKWGVYETLFFTDKKNNTWSKKAINKLTQIIQIMNKCEKEAALKSAIQMIVDFHESEALDKVINESNGIVKDNVLKLQVKTSKYVNKDGENKEFTNHIISELS